MTATWAELEAGAPELAARGRERIYRFGPGLGFLATVRTDGAPRLHPICPAIVDGGLWTLVGPSPKRADLTRDGRYALHSFPDPDVDDEFTVMGTARRVDDPARTAAVRAHLADLGVNTQPEDHLFELLVARALHAKYAPRPSWPPTYTKWQSPT
jgi:Pyridoxamine 5'-phosphate oxidase